MFRELEDIETLRYRANLLIEVLYRGRASAEVARELASVLAATDELVREAERWKVPSRGNDR